MEHDEKQIEAFIDQIMSADRLEKPSLDFTDQVMSKVEAISKPEATVYKPLISKPIWLVILGSFVALVVYVFLKEPMTENVWFNSLELNSIIPINPFEKLSTGITSTLIYAFVFLALMVGIQVPLLKHYFNKRMML